MTSDTNSNEAASGSVEEDSAGTDVEMQGPVDVAVAATEYPCPDAAPARSFIALLILIFIVLKVTAVEPVASWSWWWVLSPMWIPAAALVACVVGLVAAHLAYRIVATVFGPAAASIGSWFTRRRKMADFKDAP